MKRLKLGLRTAHILITLLGAILFVYGVDILTGTMSPRWDGLTYMSMAEHGVFQNPDATAPFIYRPGMPFLAGAVSRFLQISTEDGFRVVGFAFSALLLVLAYWLAWSFVRNKAAAVFVAVTVGLSAAHVKFPLYHPTLVDVAAYPLLLLGLWAGLRGRYRTALAVSLVGLLFKEFLIIPLVLVMIRVSRDSDLRPQRKKAFLAAAWILGPAVFLLPRVLLPVDATYQEIDPIHDPESLRLLISNPVNFKRDVNIVFCLVGYWLPTWLLFTPGRFRSLWKRLQGIRGWLGVYLGLVILLTVYGGTNIFVFVSYAMVAQIIVLAYLWREWIPVRELILVLLALFLYNRIPWDLPDPALDFDAYVDFYGGWATRLPRESGFRVLEMAGYAVLMLLVRVAGSRDKERRRRPRPFADPRHSGDAHDSR